jgi:UDP-N-acetylglucosamine acyltransferase
MGAVVGHDPQDLAYSGSESYVRMGDRNVVREHAQIHRGTKPGSATTIGSDNYFMNNAHVAHNCRVGNRVTLANGAVLGGYVEVEDQVFISANCAVHQFVRVGRLAFMRGLSRVSRDVPPFCVVDDTHTVRALNRVGLRRAGFSTTQIRELQNAFSRLFRRPRNLGKAMAEVENGPCSPEVCYLLDFIRASRRGVCVAPRSIVTRNPETDDE